MSKIKLLGTRLHSTDFLPDITTSDNIRADSDRILSCEETDWTLTELEIAFQYVKMSFTHPTLAVDEETYILIEIQPESVLMFEIEYDEDTKPRRLRVDCVEGKVLWEDTGVMASEYTCRVTEEYGPETVRRISTSDSKTEQPNTNA